MHFERGGYGADEEAQEEKRSDEQLPTTKFARYRGGDGGGGANGSNRDLPSSSWILVRKLEERYFALLADMRRLENDIGEWMPSYYEQQTHYQHHQHTHPTTAASTTSTPVVMKERQRLHPQEEQGVMDSPSCDDSPTPRGHGDASPSPSPREPTVPHHHNDQHRQQQHQQQQQQQQDVYLPPREHSLGVVASLGQQMHFTHHHHQQQYQSVQVHRRQNEDLLAENPQVPVVVFAAPRSSDSSWVAVPTPSQQSRPRLDTEERMVRESGQSVRRSGGGGGGFGAPTIAMSPPQQRVAKMSHHSNRSAPLTLRRFQGEAREEEEENEEAERRKEKQRNIATINRRAGGDQEGLTAHTDTDVPSLTPAMAMLAERQAERAAMESMRKHFVEATGTTRRTRSDDLSPHLKDRLRHVHQNFDSCEISTEGSSSRRRKRFSSEFPLSSAAAAAIPHRPHDGEEKEKKTSEQTPGGYDRTENLSQKRYQKDDNETRSDESSPSSCSSPTATNSGSSSHHETLSEQGEKETTEPVAGRQNISEGAVASSAPRTSSSARKASLQDKNSSGSNGRRRSDSPQSPISVLDPSSLSAAHVLHHIGKLIVEERQRTVDFPLSPTTPTDSAVTVESESATHRQAEEVSPGSGGADPQSSVGDKELDQGGKSKSGERLPVPSAERRHHQKEHSRAAHTSAGVGPQQSGVADEVHASVSPPRRENVPESVAPASPPGVRGSTGSAGPQTKESAEGGTRIGSAAQREELDAELWAIRAEQAVAGGQWKAKKDPKGRTYYWNVREKATCWNLAKELKRRSSSQ